MTITTQTLRNDYTANGVNTSFSFTFPIFYESNATPKFSLEVITTDVDGIETIKTETTDYTITYTTIENGVISQGNVVFNTAPTNGHKVSLLRKVNLTQNGDFTNKGTDDFNGATLESALDKLTLLSLQQQENLNRVVRLPKSSPLTNIEFPIDATRANQVVVINNAGDNLATKKLADIGLTPVSPYIATLLDNATASQARTTLDAQQLNANLSALSGLSGASNKIPYFTGAGAMALTDVINPATTSTRGITFLNNPITIANNATTPNTDINFSGGNFQLNDGSGQAVVTAMTKRLQSSGSWSAGNNGNLLTTGARANSSTYHLYSITNPATGASDYMALLGVAGTAPDPISVLPNGYTKFDLITSVETDASGNIRTGTYTFFRGGYKFKLNGNGVQTYSGTSIATPTLRAILAPRGLSVELDFVVAHFLTSGSGTMGSLYSNEGKTASSTNSQIQGFYSGSAFNYGGSPPNVFSNTSSQVYESLYFGSTTTNTTYITCYGWTFYKK